MSISRFDTALALGLLAAALLLLAPAPAQSQPASLPAAPTLHSADIDDPSFGPLLTIEDIEVAGNRWTSERLIRRVLPIVKGEMLRAGDPRFQKARFKLMATGYFREVELKPRKGTRPGHVIVTVMVKERGTVILEGLYFGTSRSSRGWAGLDITERNFLGTGIGIGGGGLYAAPEEIPGAEAQWAAEVRIADSAITGSPWGIHAAFLYTSASEPYRIAGAPEDSAANNFAALAYTRARLTGGLTFELTPLAHLTVDGRAEWINTEPPPALEQTLPGGNTVPVDIDLITGKSRVFSLLVGFDRDTRTDPILPADGDRLVMLGQVAAEPLGASYTFAMGLARYERWWRIRPERHVLSIHVTGGFVLGDAPRFYRLHAADLSRLLTPRAFGLVLSNSSSPDILGTGTGDLTYGDVGASAVVEYSYQLFRNRFYVYGGDFFFGAGIWGLGPARDDAAAVDLLIDAGLRIDTEIGIFELTFANALGRAPIP